MRSAAATVLCSVLARAWVAPPRPLPRVAPRLAADAPGEPAASLGAGAEPPSLPLKTFVFVDGTWLYYSFYGRGRRCAISAKYGEQWERTLDVDWGALPAVIGTALDEQLAAQQRPELGAAPAAARRRVDVARVIVFSSMRPDTHPGSPRARMYAVMEREPVFEVRASRGACFL